MNGFSIYNEFLLNHKPQLIASGVPEHFWPIVFQKLNDQIFDAGLFFQLVKIEYDESEKKPYDPLWSVLAIQDIDHTDSNNIFLIDHAWTFKVNCIKDNLKNIPRLLDRMCQLMQINSTTNEEKIEEVNNCIWRYAHTYAIGGAEFSAEDRVPLWYVLDELGSGINHSDYPNFRAVPFMYINEQVTYTLLFPIRNIEEGDIVTRNFVEGHFSEPQQRDAMLIPWAEYESCNESFMQEEPSENYFLEGHIVESLPNLNLLQNRNKQSSTLKVFSEYRFINENLNSHEFEIVDNERDADILWYINHFKNFEQLSEESPNKFVNQFPFEYVITIKDLLAIVSRRCKTNQLIDEFDTLPSWLPVTFNMKTELPKLVSYFKRREKAKLDNYWICKPYNLARGLDTSITNNLNLLCRLPLTGPKIAQKYLEDPVLFERPEVGLVKFDIRYVILLKSVNPTQVFIYNNFFLRFSNKQFALNNFDDYEQHFTVMNYTEGVTLHRMLCHEFKDSWSKQYASHSWSKIEEKIFQMFSEVFAAATSKPPPCGIAESPQSRALYAADIMLSWHNQKSVIQPKLLEINWMPDCKRACEYYPDFYNDIFSVLFLDKNVSTCTKVL